MYSTMGFPPPWRLTMSKYVKYRIKQKPKKEMNPVWRGIGCILFVVVPLMAFGLMVLIRPALIASGKVPWQLTGYVHFPEWAYRVMIVRQFALFIGSFKDLWLNIIIFWIIVLLLTTVASLLYAWIYTMVGPARYTALDAPPSKHRGKNYKR
jgi:hypothetical protein